MFARQVMLTLKPNMVVELKKTMETEVLPLLRKQQGFKDTLFFVQPEGKTALGISLWEKKENLDTYTQKTYPELMKVLTKFVEGTPEVRVFELTHSTLHKLGVAA